MLQKLIFLYFHSSKNKQYFFRISSEVPLNKGTHATEIIYFD